MRYVGNILTAIREHTDNLEFTREDATGAFTEGLSNNLLLEYLNDAQDFLQSRIIQSFASAFVVSKEIDLVANQELYTIDDNVFLNNKLVNVQYSHDGQIKNYRDLARRGLEDRDTSTSNGPNHYIRAMEGILINPIPRASRGKIRPSYYRELDDLDLRRGKIASKTSTTITLENDSDLDGNALSSTDYICTVSKLGVVKDYEIEVSSYSSSTRVITIPTTTLAAVAGDYVVTGQYATTHSDLAKNAERFLKVYAQLRTFHKDSSEDSVLENPILQSHLSDLLDSYAEMDHDIVEIPVINKELGA